MRNKVMRPDYALTLNSETFTEVESAPTLTEEDDGSVTFLVFNQESGNTYEVSLTQYGS